MTWKQDERESLLCIFTEATFLIFFQVYMVAEERTAPASLVVGVSKMPNVTTTTHRDPVCGMRVNEAKAAGPMSEKDSSLPGKQDYCADD